MAHSSAIRRSRRDGATGVRIARRRRRRNNALVDHHWPLRRDRSQNPYHFHPVPRLDRFQRLEQRRARRCPRQHSVHCAHVRLRGPARIRPHRGRPPVWHPNAGGDATADRRRRQPGTPAERPRAGARGRARWARRQSRRRLGSDRGAGLGSRRRPDADRQSEPVARRPFGDRQHLSRRLQSYPRLSDGWRAGAACALGDAGRRPACDGNRGKDLARLSRSALGFSAYSAIHCSCSSPSSSISQRLAKRR